MNISVSLTPETEKRLAARAARQGTTIQGLIQDIVENEASASELTERGQTTGQTEKGLGVPQASPDDYNGETPWRGVFAPAHRRKTLFTADMEFRLAELPRREPRVTISPRWVDDDE